MITETTEEWFKRIRREAREISERDSRAHFAESSEIPDVDFPGPDCPICGLDLNCDDGWYCEICMVYWPINGQRGERQE